MSRFVVRLCMIVVALLSLPQLASAVERPYFAMGKAQFISPTQFVGSGLATYLGHYSEAGEASFQPTADPAVLQVSAHSTYIAANGDKLTANFSGQLNGTTGSLFAIVTYSGGTGRFFAARGCSILVGQMQADGTITVTVLGLIDY